MERPNPFIYKIDSSGNSFATDNPNYKVYIQNEKFKLYLEKSGIPEFYWNIEFSDFVGNKKSTEYRKILYYANNITDKLFDHVHLYLWGIQGSQKSALSCNIGKSAIRKGLKVKFILAGDLIDDLLKLQGYNNNEILYNKIEDLKTNYDLIIVDDIGDPKKSATWKSDTGKDLVLTEWDRFFRKVLYNKTKLVLTSNFPIEIMKEYFSDSIYEMLDRNVEKIHLTDSVKEVRKLNVQSAFEGVI